MGTRRPATRYPSPQCQNSRSVVPGQRHPQHHRPTRVAASNIRSSPCPSFATIMLLAAIRLVAQPVDATHKDDDVGEERGRCRRYCCCCCCRSRDTESSEQDPYPQVQIEHAQLAFLILSHADPVNDPKHEKFETGVHIKHEGCAHAYAARSIISHCQRCCSKLGSVSSFRPRGRYRSH